MAALTTTLRRMAPDDVAAVAALERAVFPDPWSEDSFAAEVAGSDRVYVVAEDAEGAIAGYAGLMVVLEDAHITTMAVAAHARGGGLGTRLMLQLAEEALGAGASHLTLEVRRSNAAARRLYARFGFEEVGLRKHYYRDEDAIVMWAVDIDGTAYRERLDCIVRELG